MPAGKTIGENLDSVPDLKQGQQVIKPLETPIKETGHLQARDVPFLCNSYALALIHFSYLSWFCLSACQLAGSSVQRGVHC